MAGGVLSENTIVLETEASTGPRRDKVVRDRLKVRWAWRNVLLATSVLPQRAMWKTMPAGAASCQPGTPFASICASSSDILILVRALSTQKARTCVQARRQLAASGGSRASWAKVVDGLHTWSLNMGYWGGDALYMARLSWHISTSGSSGRSQLQKNNNEHVCERTKQRERESA